MNKPITIQLGLFDQPTLNVIRPIKQVMNTDVRECGLSREQIVDRMNDLAARFGVCLVSGNCKRLTVETFEKWLNPNELNRSIPLKALPVFCAAVERCSVIETLARPLGLRIVDDREQKLLSWAKAKMDIKEKNRIVRRIESEL
ncbi:hypothetical protein DSCW_17880 [Desulfosarcina widdelii]|uniref:Uncharacterized protein n=1 Tax=Desulfosarcina widdelii TaxID=947919 RepID=A0A5K7Z465_9BACT|nr:hypothetical protein [Desulfosarcina widdelii]BBO74371.1 hypothetical protein DSCW_17880 [Desulfosarcina widdelii]